MSALISWFMNSSTDIADTLQDDTYFACSAPGRAAVGDLLHMALLGLTCCPMRNCCSFLMSTRAWAMSSGSLLWDGPPSWEASSPAERDGGRWGQKERGQETSVSSSVSWEREFSITFNLLIFKYKHHTRLIRPTAASSFISAEWGIRKHCPRN